MTSVAPRRSARTQPSKGDRREQALLAAAERLLATGGFASASVADLAGEAGISRAGFYFYFASKQALLSAVIAAAVADFESVLSEDLGRRSDLSPAELVAATVRAATDLWWEHRITLVASVELGAALPEVYDRNRATITEVGAATLALLRGAGHPLGSDEPDTPGLLTALILMTERNFYDLARRDAPRTAYDALAAVLTTIWQRALEVGEAPAPRRGVP